MATSTVEAERRALVRRSWAAVGAGEAFVVAAGLVALVGAFSEFEFCLEGCPPDESGLGATAIVAFVLAAAFLIGGLWWAAYLSRRTVSEAVIHGALAIGVFGAVVLLVWVPFGAEGFAPGLVLAVGGAGAIAVREPVFSARYLRIGAIVALTLAARVDDNLALVVLALLTFPAIGAADTIVLRLAADAER